ncbi:MAG: hypothetical protein ACO3RB_03910, partial [Ilumatobacteraceae bacterium]
MGDTPWQGDACSLVDEFRAGRRSPREEMEATLAAVAASGLNAVSHVDPDRALAAAEAADASWIGIGLGLLLLALVLFAVELFIPSGGMLGILCGLTAIASVTSFFFYSPAAARAISSSPSVAVPSRVAPLWRL